MLISNAPSPSKFPLPQNSPSKSWRSPKIKNKNKEGRGRVTVYTELSRVLQLSPSHPTSSRGEDEGAIWRKTSQPCFPPQDGTEAGTPSDAPHSFSPRWACPDPGGLSEGGVSQALPGSIQVCRPQNCWKGQLSPSLLASPGCLLSLEDHLVQALQARLQALPVHGAAALHMGERGCR